MNRREFIINSAGIAAITAGEASGLGHLRRNLPNNLPKWRGFNLLDFFSPDPTNSRKATSEEYFKWMSDWGFDFVRVPMAYPAYLRFDRSRNITPEEVYQIDERIVERIDQLVVLAGKYNLHVSLNLHRAPGYCVNAGFYEPYNLWTDRAAMDAFCFHWNMWAKRYKQLSRKKISFDLLNEPSVRADMNDQLAARSRVPGELYRALVLAASEAIRRENPEHLIIADGNDVGSSVIPEIADLDIAQSCRGYHPGIISHYKAPWANKNVDTLPVPQWPGQVGDRYLSRAMLETFYKPWIEMKEKGVGVHCGECGCWNKTPHAVFLSWFEDVLDILTSNGIGFALWEFAGDFGVLNSNRADVGYEDFYGQKLDRKLLTLMQKY